MMRFAQLRILGLAIVLIGLGSLPLRAQTSEPDNSQRIQELLEQLESPETSEREAAERELVELGPDVLNHLPQVTPQTSAELKLRLARIQSELGKRYAASLAGGALVSLQGEVKLSEALQQLEQQSGNALVDFRARFGQPTDDPQLDLQFEDVPYLEALDRVLDAAQLDLYPYAGEVRKLAFISRTGNRRPRGEGADYSGLFRVEPVSVAAERDLRVPENRILRLSLEMIWEPRVLPLLIIQPLDQIELLAPDGSSIGVTQAEGTLEIPVQSTVGNVMLDLPLALPDRSVPRIGTLRGQARAIVPGMNARFTFDDFMQASGQRQEKAGIAVQLEGIRPNDAAVEVRVRLTLDNANPTLQSYLDWAAGNIAVLEAPDGSRITDPSYEKYLERANMVGFAYLFPIPDQVERYRFVYETPSLILEVPIHYELSDVPLP